MITQNNATELFDLAYEIGGTPTTGESRADLVQRFAARMLDVIRDGDSDWRTRREAIRPAISLIGDGASKGEVDTLIAAVNSRLSLLQLIGNEERLVNETPVLLTVRHSLGAIRKTVA